ncbi:MAG: hypothetical protein AAAB19_05905, partial [Rhizobium sp.]
CRLFPLLSGVSDSRRKVGAGRPGRERAMKKNSQWFKISHRNALLYTESASADLIKLAVRLRLAPYPTVVFDIFNER